MRIQIVFSRALKGFVVWFCLCGLAGCGLFPQKDARISRDKGGLTVITYPAEMRGAYVVEQDKKLTVCSEPAPDDGLSTVAEISGKLAANVDPNRKLEAEAAAKVTTEALALAGRTQLVLVAREMLYSLCVVSANSGLAPDKVEGIYLQVADVIKELAKADRADAERRFIELYERAQSAVQVERSKVDRIVEFVAPGGVLERGSDGKLTKLEALLSKIDAGTGPKVDDPAKARLRAVKSAAELRRVLNDVVDRAVEPLFNAIDH